MIEIKLLRKERNKTFDLGNGKRRLVCHCKPIHYLKDNKFEDINLDFREEIDKFITDENKVSIGFRKDLEIYKYFGVRYDEEHQFEGTIKEIKLDKVEQVKGDKVSSLQRKSPIEIRHQLNPDIEIINRINEVSLKNFVKVSNPIEDFRIVEELHLKGLTCSNKKKGISYTPDEFGRFNFVDEKGELKFWINPPFFEDSEGEISQNIVHTLQEVSGHLIYIKTPTKEGQDDLVLAQYPILVDTNTYFSSTSDNSTYLTGTDWTIQGDATGTAVRVANLHENSSAMDSYYSAKGPTTQIERSFFYFDTSDLGAGATVTAAVLKIYGYLSAGSSVSAQKGTQADPLTTADYNNFTGSEYAHVAWAINQYNTITFNAQGKSDVVVDGTTKICCREYTYDYGNTIPDADYANGCYYSDEELTTKDPKLEIDYTENGAIASKRLLRGQGI